MFKFLEKKPNKYNLKMIMGDFNMRSRLDVYEVKKILDEYSSSKNPEEKGKIL